jgi:predicted dehydrogenase
MVARAAVMPAIDASPHADIVATASLSGPVPSPWSATSVADYEAVLDHPAVEAVYIPLPNDLHRIWTIRAAAAGKHVLCEKPLGVTADDARVMLAACDSSGVLLAEAWMTPFDPRWAHTMRLVDEGFIGSVTEVNAAFTFTIGPEGAANYRWRPDQGGGALLDVGIYCLGPAVELWGSKPVAVNATVIEAPSGVDAATTVRLTWERGQVARARCSFVDTEQQRLEVIGDDGALILDGDAHTGGAAATTIRHRDAQGRESTITVDADDPYRSMVDAFAHALRSTRRWPRPTERSVEMLELIERIKAEAS